MEVFTMSMYYYFMTEAKIDGNWHNIDFSQQGFDGQSYHVYLEEISRHSIGRIEGLINYTNSLSFDDLSESTKRLLEAVEQSDRDYQTWKTESNKPDGRMFSDTKFYIVSYKDLQEEQKKYDYEGYVRSQDIEKFEKGEIDDFEDCLTLGEVMELPDSIKSDFRYYRWNVGIDYIKRMLDKIQYQYQAYESLLNTYLYDEAKKRSIEDIRLICYII